MQARKFDVTTPADTHQPDPAFPEFRTRFVAGMTPEIASTFTWRQHFAVYQHHLQLRREAEAKEQLVGFRIPGTSIVLSVRRDAPLGHAERRQAPSRFRVAAAATAFVALIGLYAAGV